ncbi:hypothetical protein CRE_16992 [Caenorhabditis remanei]|uniref:Uncharacterized protein n=1 Tax=Caenorhabditis remanei TaxID=31234 RepID=E3N7V4_CAERE|nr:hypothetical protein CRE_16992 [Caenorhabditis remanei]
MGGNWKLVEAHIEENTEEDDDAFNSIMHTKGDSSEKENGITVYSNGVGSGSTTKLSCCMLEENIPHSASKRHCDGNFGFCAMDKNFEDTIKNLLGSSRILRVYGKQKIQERPSLDKRKVQRPSFGFDRIFMARGREREEEKLLLQSRSLEEIIPLVY